MEGITYFCPMHNRPVIGMVFLLFSLIAYGQGEIEKLPVGINTDAYDESSPVISRDGRKLFFTRTADPDFEATLPNGKGQWTTTEKNDDFLRQLSGIYSEISGTDVTNPTTSVLNQDIWFAPLFGDSIAAAVHPGYPINNALPNSLVSTGMTPDEYVLINEFYQDGSMYAGFSRVHMDDQHQTFPEPMYIYGFNIIQSDVNLTMTQNGHVLILSVKGPRSMGENDLYVSFYLRENVWSTPVHMGEVINSASQETTPYITPDKRFLYFSSNRPGGLGGNDIYKSERLDFTWQHWSEPERVSGDVNSAFDDSQPYFDPEARYLYFTSRRDGSSDIFRQHLFPKPRLIKPIVVRGRIVNSKTGKLTRSEVLWGQLSAKSYLEYFNSYNGQFMVTLAEYEPYKFQLRKAGHLASRILVDPRLIEKQGKDTVDITFYIETENDETMESDSMLMAEHTMPEDGAYNPLRSQADSLEQFRNEIRHQHPTPSTANAASSFYDIYFLKSKPIILSKSANALNEIMDRLHQNPNLEIMIIGHTDNVGDEGALMELSVERAEAVKAYLVEQGIPAARVQTSGMGATLPLYENSTETGREKNRRVEIKVIKE